MAEAVKVELTPPQKAAAVIVSPAGARRALADLGKKIWEKYDK